MKQTQSEQTLKQSKKVQVNSKKDENSLAKQWGKVQKMREENSSLREEIRTEHRQSVINELAQNEQMNRIQEEGSRYARKIEIETKKMQDLQHEIELAQKALNEKRQQFNSSDASEVPNLVKKVKTLEYTLEKIRMRHNESLAEIKRLKEEVNAARRERVIFDSVFKKLESDLKLKEEELKKYLFEAMQVDKEKNIAQEELHKIKQQSDKEMNQFKEEYSRAFQVNEDYTVDNNDYILEQSKLNDGSKILKSIENNQNDQIVKKQSTKGGGISRGITQKVKNDNQQIQMEIDRYEMIFEKLKIQANVDNVEQFISNYQNQEKINEELYQESNQLNDQSEYLQKEIRMVQTEIRKQNSDKDQEMDDPQTKEINELKIKYKEAYHKNQMLNSQNEQINAELESLMVQLPKLFKNLSCQNHENIGVELQVENVNLGNIIQILAQIEQKATEIVEVTNYLNQQQLKNTNSPGFNDNGVLKDKELEKSFDTQKSMNKSSKKIVEDKHQINDLLDAAEKMKETEKIMTPGDFANLSKREIEEFKDKVVQRHKKHQSHKKY